MRKRTPAARRRARTIWLDAQYLEARALLSAIRATWVGQDGHDLVGPYAQPIADGVQDIHIQVDNFAADQAIVSARLLGLGGSEWVYNIDSGSWGAAVSQSGPGAAASIFVQPDRHETGRPFNLLLSLSDGSDADIWFDGGVADPTLRMPDASVSATWIGQRGDDLTGPTAAVGPDGYQDAVVALSGLAAQTRVIAVDVLGPLGASWSYGTNPQARANAELVRESADPRFASLFISPDRDLDGAVLQIEVVYETGAIDRTEVVAGSTDAARVVFRGELPQQRPDFDTTWIGQSANGAAPSDRLGWVTVGVRGLPTGAPLVGLTLSGTGSTSWTYRAGSTTSADFHADEFAARLAFAEDPVAPGQGWIAFAPDRGRAGESMIVRATFADGSYALSEFVTQSIDLSALSARPNSLVIHAAPGADLNALAAVYGTIELAPGEYPLSGPLILDRPVTIRAPAGGVTLRFRQASNAEPWNEAIVIHAGNTTLDGFAIRFDGPIRWDWETRDGPAVIGTSDPFDPVHTDAKANIAVRNLDIESAPALEAGEEAPRLLRLTTAANGVIEGNQLRGGTVVVERGPWTITNNSHRGAVPSTWAWEVFAGHFTHDLVLRDNIVAPEFDAGIVYRFLVLTGSGDGDVIERNHVSGIGARSVEHELANAGELILTEAYNVRFEGRPLGLSSDGRVLQIPIPQGSAPTTGDVVAVLSGPHAGAWVRVAQAVSPTVLLLESALPQGIGDVSIATGFVNERFVGNEIDAQGTQATSFVLVGAHFGTRVSGNRVSGGLDGLRATAYPSERPVQWGWTHTPTFDLDISANTFENAQRGIALGVEHGGLVKSNEGRVYQTARVTDNVIAWTPDYLSNSAPRAIVIGDARSIDPNETRVALARNYATPIAGTSAASVLAISGQVNGAALVDAVIPLPPPPPPDPPLMAAPILRLVHDSGASAADLITNDVRLALTPVTGAVWYEYRLGQAGGFQPVESIDAFMPVGLGDGVHTVSVRGRDANGAVGAIAQLTFTLDTESQAISGLSSTPDGGITLFTGGDEWRVEYQTPGADWRPVTTVDRFVPEGLIFGQTAVALRAWDRAGNVSPITTIGVNLVPDRPTAMWLGQTNFDFVGPYMYAVPDGIQDLHIRLGGLPSGKKIASIEVRSGNRRWQLAGGGRTWKLVYARSGATLDLFVQSDRVEAGRVFDIRIRYKGGTSQRLKLIAGAGDPDRKVDPSTPPRAELLVAKPQGLTKLSRLVLRWLASRKRS